MIQNITANQKYMQLEYSQKIDKTITEIEQIIVEEEQNKSDIQQLVKEYKTSIKRLYQIPK